MKLVERPFVDLLKAFRSPAPTPGGGSAAALSGALGVSLLTMVGAMPKHRAASAGDVERLQATARRCEELSDRLAALIDADTAAYELVMVAYKLPKGSPSEKAERTERIQRALRTATEVPLEVMRHCAEAIAAASVVASFGNPNATSDTGVALELLAASARAAKLNVEINLASITDGDYAATIRDQAAMLEVECVRGAKAARERLGE